MVPQLFYFFLLIPVLIWAFKTFDCLIRLEYDKYHQQWIKDGQPSGMLWRPDGRPTFHGGIAAQKSMLLLLFRKPEWIASSVEACQLLKKYRILVLTWNIGIILWLFARLAFKGAGLPF